MRFVYLAVLGLTIFFETLFAVSSLIEPGRLVPEGNERALWWLQAYCVAALAIALFSAMGWALRNDRRVVLWMSAVLGFFHSVQFSGVLMGDLANGITVSPGWVHGLIALLALIVLLGNKKVVPLR